MGIRDRLKRLNREAERKMVAISQADGTVKRFYQDELEPAFLNVIALIKRGPEEEMPDEHPLVTAARNSPDPEWANSFYSAEPGEPVEDLSE